MMRVDFDETVPVSAVVVYDHLRSPTEWPRLYGGTRITGFEEIDVSAFENDRGLLETIDREFRAIWQVGWDRLREEARETAAGGA